MKLKEILKREKERIKIEKERIKIEKEFNEQNSIKSCKDLDSFDDSDVGSKLKKEAIDRVEKVVEEYKTYEDCRYKNLKIDYLVHSRFNAEGDIIINVEIQAINQDGKLIWDTFQCEPFYFYKVSELGELIDINEVEKNLGKFFEIDIGEELRRGNLEYKDLSISEPEY